MLIGLLIQLAMPVSIHSDALRAKRRKASGLRDTRHWTKADFRFSLELFFVRLSSTLDTGHKTPGHSITHGSHQRQLLQAQGWLPPSLEIGRRVNAFAAAHPEAKIIRCGIGDVTEPQPPAVIASMHNAEDEMSRPETLLG